METKFTLAERANEILADLRELEEELERNEKVHSLYYRTAKEIEAKRIELDQIRKILRPSAEL